jgi:hypothetical protein
MSIIIIGEWLYFISRYEGSTAALTSEMNKNHTTTSIVKKTFLCAISMITLATLPHIAQATPITYTLTGTGLSGTFAGTSFTGANFTFTGIGDTTATTTVLGLPAISLTSMTYNISGVTSGVATATVPFSFMDATSDIPDTFLFTDPSVSYAQAFSMSGGGWDIVSDIGPLSSTSYAGINTPTDQGDFQMGSFTSGSFTAVVGASGGGVSAPEPGTLLLLALGGGAGFASKRRRKN